MSRRGGAQGRRSAFAAERLETRTLLAARANTFAVIDGQISSPGAAEVLPITVSPGDFGASRRAVTLGFEVEAAPGSTIDPDSVRVVAVTRGAKAKPKVWSTRQDSPNGTDSLTIAAIRTGQYNLIVQGEGGTVGDYTVRVFLAGDTNGDFRVNKADYRTVRQNLHRAVADGDPLADADINGDGVISNRDLGILYHNLHVLTRIRPLHLTLQIDPTFDPDGDGVVQQSNINLLATTRPGLDVSLDQYIDGSIEQVGNSGAGGQVTYPVSILGGTTPFLAQVTDGFGQRRRATTTATIGGPNGVNNPPVIFTSPQTRFALPVAGNPASGNVGPTSINLSLIPGDTVSRNVSITLPTTGAVTQVDVFLLFDDTGSFAGTAPQLISAFPTIISRLQTDLPTQSLAFGVGRFEDYSGSDVAFGLSQPIITTGTPGFSDAINAGLNRTLPGFGGDGPETLLEGLLQVATGVGFDFNDDGDFDDANDVPPFSQFTPNPAINLLPASGSIGGVGFRPGALPIILAATDIGTVYQPDGIDPITGVGGVTVPLGDLTDSSRNTTPGGRGAAFQATINALRDLGALVIGLGTAASDFAPRSTLEGLAKLTGSVNGGTTSIDSGIAADPIDPGDPLYFLITAGAGANVADGIVAAVNSAVLNVNFDVDVRSSDPNVTIVNSTGVVPNVGGGGTATFDVIFTGATIPQSFDLQFVRAGTGVVLGSIPVTINTPYTYDLGANDPDGDSLTYLLLSGPAGASINPTSGVLAFLPPTPGDYTFQVQVTDGRGGVDVQTFTLTVTSGAVLPVVTGGLVNDTGVVDDDAITSDPTISGAITSPGTIVSLLASLSGTPTQDISASLTGGGTAFTIDAATLTALNGGTPLPDGPLTVRIRAVDDLGVESDVFEVSFTLDTTAPAAPTFDLDAASDTPPTGDRTTDQATVDLTGTTEPFAIVELLQGTTVLDTETLGATGLFLFTNVALVLGDNAFTVRVTDRTGNSSTGDGIITRI